MAKLSFGLRAGLAQDMGYDQQVADLHYNEQLNKQAQMMAEKKAALFADDFDYNNAMNQHDNPLVKQFAQAKIKEIGAFVNANPDWGTNVGKRAQYKQLVRELKDNPDLNRGLKSDANYASFQKALAEKSKHPELFNKKGYDNEYLRWKNYEQFGHPEGQEAAEKEGFQPYVFNQPQDKVDLAMSGLEKGNKFNAFDLKKMGGTGGYQQVPKEDVLNTVANDEYLRNKWQYDEEYSGKGFASPFEHAKANIRAGIKGAFSFGDINGDRMYQLAKAKSEAEKAPPGPGNYELSFAKPEQGTANAELMDKVFGTRPQFVMSNSTQTKNIDMTGNVLRHTGGHKYINGVKYVEYQTDLSREDAMQKGIVYDPWGLGDFEIEKDWEDNAKIVKISNKEGDKEVDVLRYTGWRPVKVDDATQAGMWDQESTISKYQSAPQESYQTKQQVFADESGNKFVSDGKGGYIPYQ